MRAQLEAAVPGSHAVEGRAEAMPLPDGAADVVASAQAFHWFDHDDALPEIARVLHPGGRLALVWNSRDDRDPWMARLSAIIGNESIQESDVVPILDESGLFRWVETKRFSFEQVLDRDGLRPRPLAELPREAPPEDREPVLDAVGALFDETGGGVGVRLAYVTECFRATLRYVRTRGGRPRRCCRRGRAGTRRSSGRRPRSCTARGRPERRCRGRLPRCPRGGTHRPGHASSR